MVQPTLILTQSDLRGLVGRADYLRAVEDGFRASAEGRAFSPAPFHIEADGGGLHGKGASLIGERTYLAVKVNSNFPANARTWRAADDPGRALPVRRVERRSARDHGFDRADGHAHGRGDGPCREISGAEDARTLTICGCGAQARAQAAALSDVRDFERGFAWDADRNRARDFAADMTARLGFPFEVSPSLPRSSASERRDRHLHDGVAAVPRRWHGCARRIRRGRRRRQLPRRCEIAPALMAKAFGVRRRDRSGRHDGRPHHAIARARCAPARCAANWRTWSRAA